MVGSRPTDDEREHSKQREEKIPNEMQRLTFRTNEAQLNALNGRGQTLKLKKS
jgi:hypothetical protein